MPDVLAQPALVVVDQKLTSISDDQSALEHISKRESAELVVAISGPVGSGQDAVVEELKRQLSSFDYKPRVIKLSSFLEEQLRRGNAAVVETDTANRYLRLQSAGNDLRSKYGEAVLAELSIAHIAAVRLQEQGPEVVGGSKAPAKIAWIIDQLKHPSEATLLRRIYGNLFFLLGVYSNEEQRSKRLLMDLNQEESDVKIVMDRDLNENLSHGQKLEKTLQQADYFIRNSSGNNTHISTQVKRFLELIHGKNGITPTVPESGMYAAYSAALRSACLSRQVGASIVDEKGNVIATGCNDVPKAGGGLYTSVNAPDNRCVNKGRCFNDLHKSKIEKEIREQLSSLDVGLNQSQIEGIALQLRNYTRIKDLIEFSRSVHAEMDAIVSLARAGGASTQNCTLYTTTFPCHNCARHIVASGITKVYYIEPYEKSLAHELHGEDIAFEDKDGEGVSGKVNFLHFEGVAPRRYHSFFFAPNDRKNKKGEAISFPVGEGRKIGVKYLDSYLNYEARVTELMATRGLIDGG